MTTDIYYPIFLCSQFPITALREIRILQLLKHENVVNLIEICYTKASAHNRYRPTFYLVFDFCEHDLAGLLANINVKFGLGEIKKVMQQLLNGLYYIHFNKVGRVYCVTLEIFPLACMQFAYSISICCVLFIDSASRSESSQCSNYKKRRFEISGFWFVTCF